MNPQEAEHRQLEGESLVEAARERKVDWYEDEQGVSRVRESGDEQLMRETLEALEYVRDIADGPLVVEPALPRLAAIATCARAAITKLEQRLLKE